MHNFMMLKTVPLDSTVSLKDQYLLQALPSVDGDVANNDPPNNNN